MSAVTEQGWLVWLDGEVLPAEQARIPVLDHGFTVGDAVFETTTVVEGAVIALTRHLARLQRSARGLGLVEPATERVRGAVTSLLSHRPAAGTQRLRITWTGGAAPVGSNRGDSESMLVVAIGPQAPWPETTSIATVPWTRNERSATAGLKTTSYAENVVALAEATSRGASEAIFANTRGELCEGTGTNIFVVLDDELLTPPLESGCLAGITRELVLQTSGAREAVLPLEALQAASEVFLTSSTRHVHPVRAVDGRELAAPGPQTAKAAAAYEDLLRTSPDP